MLLRLDDPSLVDDLCEHFQRSGFTAEPAGGSMVEVHRPDAPTPDQGRREAELHLRIWQATHRGVVVELLDD